MLIFQHSWVIFYDVIILLYSPTIVGIVRMF